MHLSVSSGSGFWLGAALLLLLVGIQTSSNSSLLLGFLLLGVMLAMFITQLRMDQVRCSKPKASHAANQLSARDPQPESKAPIQIRLKASTPFLGAAQGGRHHRPPELDSAAAGLALATTLAPRHRGTPRSVHLLGSLDPRHTATALAGQATRPYLCNQTSTTTGRA